MTNPSWQSRVSSAILPTPPYHSSSSLFLISLPQLIVSHLLSSSRVSTSFDCIITDACRSVLKEISLAGNGGTSHISTAPFIYCCLLILLSFSRSESISKEQIAGEQSLVAMFCCINRGCLCVCVAISNVSRKIFNERNNFFDSTGPEMDFQGETNPQSFIYSCYAQGWCLFRSKIDGRYGLLCHEEEETTSSVQET
ncbi:uncharacterized protein LOC130723820 [Lotus japonicus]|uniref:uncharacterized protein LOC130723820 n=1 Tax=Lotus japonicus TaxID=34305 RepID=UPI0025844582|nr:uncharacterized protein LOC130723820 [Lotus japonicus]